MPPDARMSLAQQLLLRALVAWFWRAPLDGKPVRWGTALHDRFMLEHFVWKDFLESWTISSRPATISIRPGSRRSAQFRFPLCGAVLARRRRRRTAAGDRALVRAGRGRRGRADRALSSIPRSSGCRSRSTGLTEGRHVVTCNGRARSADLHRPSGEFVAGVRFKAWQPAVGPAPDHRRARAADIRHRRYLEQALAGRLRLSRRPSRRTQLRNLSGQLLRGGGAPSRSLPGSRPYRRD